MKPAERDPRTTAGRPAPERFSAERNTQLIAARARLGHPPLQALTATAPEAVAKGIRRVHRLPAWGDIERSMAMTPTGASGSSQPYSSDSRDEPERPVRETAEAARERAGEMWDDAKRTTQSRLNEQKNSAADGIEEVAEALRDASRKHEGDDAVGRLTGAAAQGLERISGTLRNKDVNAMLQDMESFARQQPAAFFGLALAAGFITVRLMKSTQS
jgi:hypothetical protein